MRTVRSWPAEASHDPPGTAARAKNGGGMANQEVPTAAVGKIPDPDRAVVPGRGQPGAVVRDHRQPTPERAGGGRKRIAAGLQLCW
jgi:hypothetical protein